MDETCGADVISYQYDVCCFNCDPRHFEYGTAGKLKVYLIYTCSANACNTNNFPKKRIVPNIAMVLAAELIATYIVILCDLLPGVMRFSKKLETQT